MGLITISQNMGDEGLSIARQVAHHLDLELYDDEKLREEALQMGLRREDLQSLDEKAPGFFDRILSRKPDIYLDFMESVVFEVAQKGEGVIVGHGSQMLLRDFGCALHVLIASSEAARAERLIHQRGLSPAAAEKLIKKNDHAQMGFFQFAFNKNWNDPTLYDLIINPEKLGRETAVQLIVDAARSDEIKTCSLSALDAMQKLGLVKKIEVALRERDHNLSLLHIEMPEVGVAYIRGFSYSNAARKDILSTAGAVPGISEVQSELSEMPPE
jgi:cytidylate kinase